MCRAVLNRLNEAEKRIKSSHSKLSMNTILVDIAAQVTNNKKIEVLGSGTLAAL